MSEQLNPTQIEAVNTINRLSEFYGVPQPQIIFTKELPMLTDDFQDIIGLHCNDCASGNPVIYLPETPRVDTPLHEFAHHFANVKGIPNSEDFAEMFTKMHMQEESFWRVEFLGVPRGAWVSGFIISLTPMFIILTYLMTRRS